MSSKELDGGAGGDLAERVRTEQGGKRSLLRRIVLFVRQVIAELKKVVTPTRKELRNFTLVVLAFVVVMMAIVWLLDQAFGWVTVFLFGTPL